MGRASKNYPRELREPAIAMVREVQAGYPSGLCGDQGGGQEAWAVIDLPCSDGKFPSRCGGVAARVSASVRTASA